MLALCSLTIAALAWPAQAQTIAFARPPERVEARTPAVRARAPRRPRHGVAPLRPALERARARAQEHDAARRAREEKLQAFIDAVLPLPLPLDDLGTSSACERNDLLASCRLPAARAHAPIEFAGLQRLLHRHALRAARGLYKDAIERREALDPCFGLGDRRDAQERLQRADLNRDAWFAAPFPAYWRGQPEQRALEKERLVIGERTEILSLGPFRLHSDMRVRYRREPIGAPTPPAAAETGVPLSFEDWRRVHAFAGRYGTEQAPLPIAGYEIDGRLQLRGALDTPTLVRAVRGAVELHAFDRHDGAERWRARLDLELRPDGRARAAVTWTLARF